MDQPTEIITLDLTVDEYQRIRHALSTEAGRCREVAEGCRRHIEEYGLPENDRATPENWEEKAAAALALMNKLSSLVSYDSPEPRASLKPRLDWKKASTGHGKWRASLDEHRLIVWTEYKGRGEDMSGLRTGLWAYMPLIASGDVRPELVVQYAGHATLLRRLAGLRLEDQDRLLQDNTVPLIEYQEDGKFTERRVPITHLKSTQIAQVISDHLRSPDEQRRAAAGNARRMRRRAATTADRITELAQAMGQPKGRRVALTVTLTDAESEALAAAQARSGVPMTKLIRAMLLSSGLLNDAETDARR
jgi:hypothetical protein